MARVKKFYICNKCGYNSQQWLGKCPDCGSCNSFEEQFDLKEQEPVSNIREQIPANLNELTVENNNRFNIGFLEFDQLMGGGIVEDSVTLIGGEPGIGKSTIMLQIASMLSANNKKVLYVTSEESATQLEQKDWI